MRHLLPALLLGCLLVAWRPQPASNARGEPQSSPRPASDARAQRDPATLRVATWNIENWRDHFQAFRDSAAPPADEAARQARSLERYQNDEDNWEIAQVLLDPAFAPDILLFQEGPSQVELEEFNKSWLGGAYQTLVVFASNDERGQTIGVMLKPGLRVLETADAFHRLPDDQDLNPRTDFLFARGPAFVLVETPAGARLWVGTNHQKSKGGGNDVAITKWRNAEALATRQIMKELVARGPDRLVFMGDMNDELGIQAYELAGGGDVIANLAGPPGGGLVLATRQLAAEGQASFMGYWRADHRSLVDHVVLSEPLADEARPVRVFDSVWARVASDHLPVYVDLQLHRDE